MQKIYLVDYKIIVIKILKLLDQKKLSENYVIVKSKMTSKIDKQEIKIDWRVFKIKDKLVN